jgi:cysteinyl-tRNA synthetase
VDGEKMSKSLGNFITIRELLDRPTDPMAVRIFVLQAQYRKPIDFTDEAIAAATNGWTTLKEGLLFGYQYGNHLGWIKAGAGENKESLSPSYVQSFQEAVDDDFNFSSGLAILFELAKDLRREGNILVHEGKTETPSQELEQKWRTLVSLAQVLGLEAQPEEEKAVSGGLSDAKIEFLIQQRQDARKAKNFAEADRIRNELQTQGITLIDSPDVTRWHRN